MLEPVHYVFLNRELLLGTGDKDGRIRGREYIEMKMAWVTDSTGYLDKELSENDDVFVVPVTIHIDGKEFKDGEDISHDEIYHAISAGQSVTTSQPAVGAFLELYDRLAEMKYERIYSFLLSGKLSGTVSSSIQAGQMAKIPVHTFDSGLLSFPLTYIMKKAISWDAEKISTPHLLKKAARFRDSNETYVLIGSLDQLHRSGRLSSLKFYLGSWLKIKPIVSLTKGSLQIQEVARSEKHAEKQIFNRLRNAVEHSGITDCMILHGQFKKQAEDWKNKIMQLYPHLNLHVYPLGTAIGVHTGGTTLGISWFKEKI